MGEGKGEGKGIYKSNKFNFNLLILKMTNKSEQKCRTHFANLNTYVYLLPSHMFTNRNPNRKYQLQRNCFLNCSYQELSIILFEKLVPFSKRELGPYRVGFRRGRSITGQNFFYEYYSRKYSRWSHTILFIDLKSTYSSGYRLKLNEIMEKLGIPQKSSLDW